MRKLRTAMTSPTVIRAQVRPYISRKEKMRSRAEKFKDFLKRETKIALLLAWEVEDVEEGCPQGQIVVDVLLTPLAGHLEEVVL